MVFPMHECHPKHLLRNVGKFFGLARLNLSLLDVIEVFVICIKVFEAKVLMV